MANMANIIDACVASGFRKALSLAFWSLISECRDYDSYGQGVEGIRRFLEEKGEPTDFISKVGVASSGRLFLYITDIGEELEKLRVYRDVASGVPVPDRRYLAVLAASLAAAPTEAYKFLLERAARLPPPLLSQAAVKVKDLGTDSNGQKLQEELLGEERMVKEELLRGSREEAESRMLAIAAVLADAGAPVEWPRTVELWREGLLGMALSLIHEGIILLQGSDFKPSDIDRVVALIKAQGEENRTVRLLSFVKEYLEAARSLADYMEDRDYERISVRLTRPTEAWLQLGEHHAVARVRGSLIVVEYQDHNEKRAEALRGFLARLGLEVGGEGGAVEVRVPFEDSARLARVLAATTSLDVQGAIWVLERAGSVEELLELRRRAVEGSNGSDSEDDWS